MSCLMLICLRWFNWWLVANIDRFDIFFFSFVMLTGAFGGEDDRMISDIDV